MLKVEDPSSYPVVSDIHKTPRLRKRFKAIYEEVKRRAREIFAEYAGREQE
jgi:hypothetical protein